MTQSTMPLDLPLDLPFDLRFQPATSGRWQRWWQKRLKPSDTHRLTLHNVYVLPTRPGWMMLVTVAVLMLATINYQLNLGYVLIFLLMGAGVVGLFLAHRAMTRISLELDTSKALHGVAGEDVDVSIRVSSLGVVQLQTLTTQFNLIGLQPLPLLTCETRYPLGLLRLWSVWRLQSKAQIEPLKVISNLDSPSAAPASFDPIKDDFRAYRVGDAPRDLLWKTVAKRPDSPSSWGVRERTLGAPSPVRLEVNRHAVFQGDQSEHQHQQGLQAVLLRRDQLLLNVLLAIALPFFLHLHFAYPLLAVLLISARLWLTTTATGHAPQWLQLPLIAGLGALIWLQFRSFNGIEVSVSGCIGLLGIKALELPPPKLDANATATATADGSHHYFSRDRWVLVFLGLLTLAAHFLVSQTLLSSVLVVLGLVGLIYVLIDAHSPGVVAGTKMRTTALLVVLGAPIMLVLFFLFPRFAPLWTLTPPKTTAVSGLSNEMRVGDISQISLDNRIMLRLSIDPPAQLASKDIYLRGPVLPYFDGRSWRTYVRGQTNDKLPPTELDWLGTPPVSYTVFEGGTSRKSTTSALLRNNAQSTSLPYLEVARSLPAQSNPRTRQWLRGLQADSRFAAYEASDWSAFLLRHLQTGGFTYSLEPGLYGEHMADELLFDRPVGNKSGFCEHYASVFVIAMRHLGVPARVVTGYQGAEVNPLDGLLVVRNRNAHAWAEYWRDSAGQQGWQRVDPTAVVAPSRIESAEAFNQAPEQAAAQKGLGAFTISLPWLRTARQTWEATSHAWESWMQGYNQGEQRSLLKKLGFDAPSWQSVLQLLNAALVLLLLLGAAAYVLGGKVRSDPWLVLLNAARNQLQNLGIALEPHASPKAMAALLSLRYGTQATQANRWLLALEQARYSPAHADLSTLKRRFKSAFSPLSS